MKNFDGKLRRIYFYNRVRKKYANLGHLLSLKLCRIR